MIFFLFMSCGATWFIFVFVYICLNDRIDKLEEDQANIKSRMSTASLIRRSEQRTIRYRLRSILDKIEELQTPPQKEE